MNSNCLEQWPSPPASSFCNRRLRADTPIERIPAYVCELMKLLQNTDGLCVYVTIVNIRVLGHYLLAYYVYYANLCVRLNMRIYTSIVFCERIAYVRKTVIKATFCSGRNAKVDNRRSFGRMTMLQLGERIKTTKDNKKNTVANLDWRLLYH